MKIYTRSQQAAISNAECILALENAYDVINKNLHNLPSFGGNNPEGPTYLGDNIKTDLRAAITAILDLSNLSANID